LTLLPILSGSIIFLADLMRKLPIKMKIALVGVSSYPGKSTNPRTARTVLDINSDLRDRHVLIVDDILDTGNTLRRVTDMVQERSPASVRTAVLLRKPARAPADVSADFIGFDIEDEFVVGYGLDYDDHYRNFPHIGILRDDLIT
ncbi:MAG: hypoxanthine phosphoribosyltransferase, partial [Phycisphaerae bacterium]